MSLSKTQEKRAQRKAEAEALQCVANVVDVSNASDCEHTLSIRRSVAKAISRATPAGDIFARD
jgi:hypothetical protein